MELLHEYLKTELAMETAAAAGRRPVSTLAPQPPGNPNLPGAYQPVGGWTTIDVAGKPYEAYLSRPRRLANAPGVLVIHHAGRFIRPYIRDVAEGLSAAGYIALAPELLSGAGGADQFGNDMARITGALLGIPTERHLGVLRAALTALRSQAGVGKLGVIGFCFGGGLAWRLITEEPGISAAAPFYGPNPPLDQVPGVAAATWAVYAEDDDLINPGVPALRTALDAAGAIYQMRTYPGTRHGFHSHHNPDRYQHEPARQAWTDALAWFGEHLAG